MSAASRQLKGALLAFTVGLAFVAMEPVFHVHTAIAGVFITGLAGGLLIGDRMGKGASSRR